MRTENSWQVFKVSFPLVLIAIALLLAAIILDVSWSSREQPKTAEFEVGIPQLSADAVLQATTAEYIPQANQFSSPSLSILPLSYIKYAGELQFGADGSLAPNSVGRFATYEAKAQSGASGSSPVLVSYRDKASDRPNTFFGVEDSSPGFIFLVSDDSGVVSVYSAVSLKKYQEVSPPQYIFDEGTENQLFLVTNTGGLNPATGLWGGVDVTVVVAQRLDK